MCIQDRVVFWRSGLTSDPIECVLGLPGLGKSALVRLQAHGLAGYSVLPLVLGDLKPDYVDLITALGGQVITLGRRRWPHRGRGCSGTRGPARG